MGYHLLTQYTTAKYEEADVKVFSKDEITSGGLPKPSVGKNGDVGVLGIDANGKATAETHITKKHLFGQKQMTTAFEGTTGKDCRLYTRLNRPPQKDGGALANGDMTLPNNTAASI